jgi:hypothetical protein
LEARRPYNVNVAPGQSRLGVTLRWVLAAYIVALAAMPFAHHDIVCHLKSSTHCATCHVGTSADPGGPRPAIAASDLVDAGCASERSARVSVSCAISPSSGRAPPAAPPTSLL